MTKNCPHCEYANMVTGSLSPTCRKCGKNTDQSANSGSAASRGGRYFSNGVVIDAWVRQRQRCALCGENLTNLTFQAHHMRRWADGGDSRLDNCALLCDDCHYEAHNSGRYVQPFELLQSEYEYINGRKERKG